MRSSKLAGWVHMKEADLMAWKRPCKIPVGARGRDLGWEVGVLTPLLKGVRRRAVSTEACVFCRKCVASAVDILASTKCCCTPNCARGRPALVNKDIWHTIDNLYI
jgi:hypothetical protein